MMKLVLSSILSTLALRALAIPYPSVPYPETSSDGGDGGGDILSSESTFISDVTTVIPQYNCGYTDVEFDDSLNTFASNDTVWFYADDNANCGPPENGKPCNGYMLFTGNYGDYFGYMPYSVWYTFETFNDDWVVTLRYNYNGGQTSIVDTVLCDGNEYKSTLNRCMFNEELYSYEFFKYYQFNFYTTCTYDSDANTMFFNLEQESRTCVSDDGTTNDNRFTLSQFDNWCPQESYVQSDVDEFCPNCRPTPPPPETQTVTNTVTETTTATATATATVTNSPTPTCVSCEGGNNIVVNVNVQNKNKAPSPVV